MSEYFEGNLERDYWIKALKVKIKQKDDPRYGGFCFKEYRNC
ncbi:MAG: hypothetical protein ACLRQX_07475 [Turicibacter sanguinis]